VGVCTKKPPPIEVVTGNKGYILLGVYLDVLGSKGLHVEEYHRKVE
jgi:hypothetical protein